MWNINGISDKLNDFDVTNIINSHDIIGLVETKKGDVSDLNYTGYNSYHFSRSYKHKKAKRHDGGILLLVSKRLSSVTVQKQQTSECVSWVNIKFRENSTDKNIFIGIVYIPPKESSFKKAANFHEELADEIKDKKARGQVFISGDLNSRSSDLLDYIPNEDVEFNFPSLTCPRYNVDGIVNNYGRKLIELCIGCGIQILNGRNLFSNNTNQYTCFRYNGKSIVDVLMTSADAVSRVTDFSILPRNINSDHSPLSFTLTFTLAGRQGTKPQNPNTRDSSYKQIRYIWDCNKIDTYYSSLQNPSNVTHYEKFLCDISCPSMNPNEAIESFYNYLNHSISATFRKFNPKSHNNSFPCKKWFDSECKILKSKVNDSYRQNAPIQIQNALRMNYQSVIQRKKREFQIKETDKLSHLCIHKQQEFWKRWKKLKGQSHSFEHITIDKFTEFYISACKPNIDPTFDTDFMTDLSNAMDIYGDGDDKPSNPIIDDILNGPITLQEIHKALKSSKTGKACGIDGIQTEFIKFSNGLLDKPIISLYNYIFDKGVFPEAWSTGLINPIFKQKDKSSPENYRKITLLTSLSKTFENILNNRLSYCKETIIPDDPLQNGFKKDAPVTDNVFILNGIIEKQKVTKKPLYVCFVDFKSAFDLVNRQALYYKLQKQDIKGKFYKIIRSMLNNAKSRVKWDSSIGDIIDNLYGVIQGGVLSPSLFKMFIEDLPKYLDKETGIQMGEILINYLLHADDLVLISETSAGLQKLLRGLEHFCSRWHITVNLIKTNIMIFNKNCSIIREVDSFFFFNNKITEVDKYKYLGIIFTNANNLFAENIEYLRKKAIRAIGDIRTNISKITGANKPYNVMIKLFDSQILPILEYGSEIWYPGKGLSNYETVHLNFFKYVLGVKSQTSSLAIYGDTGRFPLVMRQQDRAIKLWSRLKYSRDNKPINNVFHELEKLQNLGHKTWLTKIKNSLGEMYCNLLDDENPNRLITRLKETRYKNYMESLITDINDITSNPKLRTYCLFKTDYRKEAYLYHIHNRNFLTAISRFRTSSHSLHIETGRHTIPYTPAENRLCSFCDLNSVDDEIHMLLKCTFHKTERENLNLCIQHYLQRPISEFTDQELFCKVMKMKCPEVLNAIGKYLYTGFSRRKTLSSITTTSPMHNLPV